MRIEIRYDPERSELTMTPSADENDKTAHFSERRIYFSLPPGDSNSLPHPDLVALAAVLSFHPFVGTRLELDISVSESFSRTCARYLPYALVTRGPRRGEVIAARPKGRYPGLSFSGGVDSTACLALLPADTKLFFLDRVPGPGDRYGGGLYVKDSALAACDLAHARGYEVHRMETNVELIRTPVGFPVDWTSGVPAILLADHCDLSSVSFGTVAESAYKVGHLRYRDFSKTSGFYRWNALLQSAGLSLSLPVAGLSEVCTSLLVERSGMREIAQSCIRGRKNQPCLNCFKCFRKVLLEAALEGKSLSGATVDRLINFRGAAKALGAIPIKHEDVLLWLRDKVAISGSSLFWPLLERRLSAMDADVGWASRWYAKSLDVLPEELRDPVAAHVRRYVQTMTDPEIQAFEAWDLEDRLQRSPLTSSSKALSDAIISEAAGT